MLARVVMRKFLSAILILLSMTLLMAASPALTISEGNIDDVELFAPDGTSLSVLSDIDESGYVIRTNGEMKAFTSQFGDVYLQGDSVLAVTGFTTADPTLYLVYGRANVVMKEDLPLNFYTPTSRTTISGTGEYAFVSTDDEEAFMNYSSSPASAYDAMRARSFEVPSMSELSYADGAVVPATQKSYYATTVLADLVIYDAAEVPAEPVVETVEETIIPAEPIVEEEEEVIVPAEPVVEAVEETIIPAEPIVEEEEVEEIPAAEEAVPDAPIIIEPVSSVEGVMEPAIPAIPAAPTFAGVTTALTEAAVPSAPVLLEPAATFGTAPSAPSSITATATLTGIVPAEPAPEAETALVPTAPVSESESAIAEPASMTEDEEHLITVGVEVGASYPLNWNKIKGKDGEPLILATPYVNIGRGNWQIGLRAPLQMAFIDEFRLAGFSGKSDWDFGTEKGITKEEAIYDAITDSMALIDHLYLGNPDYTIAYLRMERGYERNSTIFSSYGWDEGLAVRLGFNFSNLAFQIYLDNAEAPHIGELSLAFYPFAFRGTSFSINVPTEVLFTSFDDYEMFFFPEVRLDIPFADRSFILSVFATGSMYTSYNDRQLNKSEIIYDFNEKKMLPFLAGAELTFEFKPVKVELSGGYRSGRLSSEYFNEFTFAEHKVSVFDEYAKGGNAFFASAALTLDFDVVSVGLSYSVDDIQHFSTDPMDIARIKVEGHAGSIADIYATAAVRGLVSSFKGFDAKEFFMGPDFLFAVGFDLDFGMFGLTAEARTVHLPEGSSGLLNVHNLSEDTYLQFKLLGRVEFGWL